MPWRKGNKYNWSRPGNSKRRETAVFTTLRGNIVAVLLVVGLVTLAPTNCARAQSTTRSQQLSALQQQNAVLQQRNAVQTAALQTTALLQAANQQNTGA